jgi:hypothetical protein
MLWHCTDSPYFQRLSPLGLLQLHPTSSSVCNVVIPASRDRVQQRHSVMCSPQHPLTLLDAAATATDHVWETELFRNYLSEPTNYMSFILIVKK